MEAPQRIGPRLTLTCPGVVSPNAAVAKLPYRKKVHTGSVFMGAFKEPHGGELKELYLTESGAEQEKVAAASYPNWNLTDRQLCDLELLLNGAFSPLDGFLSRAAYESVLARMRLPSGLVWPIPITLDVTREFAAGLKEGDRIALRDPEGVLIATMEVSDVWEPDKAQEARSVFGTGD